MKMYDAERKEMRKPINQNKSKVGFGYVGGNGQNKEII